MTVKTATDVIDVVHGVRLRVPSGDVYSFCWDEFAERVLVILDTVGDNERRTGALALTPRAANAIELKPRRRDE